MKKDTAKNFHFVIKSVFTFTLVLVLMSGCSAHKHVANSVDIVVYSNDSVTTKAEFPGGQGEYYRYLNNNFEYPFHAAIQGEKGLGIYDFVINKEGSITDVKVVKSVGASIDKTVIQLIKKMPKWKPATLNGSPVSVMTTLKWNFGSKRTRDNKAYDLPAFFPGDPLAFERYLKEHEERTQGVGMSGLVKVSFIVDEKGDITKPRIIKGLNHRAESIALSLVKSMPRWEPAMKDRKPVPCERVVSIYFSE